MFVLMVSFYRIYIYGSIFRVAIATQRVINCHLIWRHMMFLILFMVMILLMVMVMIMFRDMVGFLFSLVVPCKLLVCVS